MQHVVVVLEVFISLTFNILMLNMWEECGISYLWVCSTAALEALLLRNLSLC